MCLLCFIIVTLAGLGLVDAEGATKPNVLLIVADDLGYADVNFYPNSESVVLTPNLRELAMGGVRLANHHVQPFCSPTRATIMTGRHVLRYGLQNTVIWPQDAWALPQNETIMPQFFKALGYRTAQMGKWHLGLFQDWALPQARGFDHQYGYYLGGEDYWDHSRNGGLDWHREGQLVVSENGTYSADLLGDAAIHFINGSMFAKDPKQPWFLYLPFQSVHAPLQAEKEDLDKYPHLESAQKTRAAMVSALDRQVGKITQVLEGSGQLNHTIIVFTSDNGAPFGDAFDMGDDPLMLQLPQFQTHFSGKADRPPTGSGVPLHGGGGGSNAPLSGWKHWVFEGGVRSASFVRYPPMLAAGKVHHGLFHSVDWLPTLLGMVAGDDSELLSQLIGPRNTIGGLPLDGLDILPALQGGERDSPHDELPLQITACGKGYPKNIVDGPGAAIIVGDLKLIVDCYWRQHKNTSTAQLYNITADLAEMHNLVHSRSDDVQRLLDRLEHWEQLSVLPYNMHGINASCGKGEPQGNNPPRWDPWC